MMAIASCEAGSASRKMANSGFVLPGKILILLDSSGFEGDLKGLYKIQFLGIQAKVDQF